MELDLPHSAPEISSGHDSNLKHTGYKLPIPKLEDIIMSDLFIKCFYALHDEVGALKDGNLPECLDEALIELLNTILYRNQYLYCDGTDHWPKKDLKQFLKESLDEIELLKVRDIADSFYVENYVSHICHQMKERCAKSTDVLDFCLVKFEDKIGYENNGK